MFEKVDEFVEKEIASAKNYLNMRLQLMFQCTEYGGSRISKSQLPSYEKVKENPEQFFTPYYQEIKYRYKGKELIYTCVGMDAWTHNITTIQHYNIFIGCKYNLIMK